MDHDFLLQRYGKYPIYDSYFFILRRFCHCFSDFFRSRFVGTFA